MSTATNVVDLKGKYKVAKEVAEAEFIRLCQANRIDSDTSEMKEDELKEWTDLKDEIVRDLRVGTLIVGEDGRPTYTPPGSSKGYTFHAATGATIMALESYGKDKGISNLVAAMAEVTRTERGEFSKLPAKDFQACSRIMRLFITAA